MGQKEVRKIECEIFLSQFLRRLFQYSIILMNYKRQRRSMMTMTINPLLSGFYDEKNITFILKVVQKAMTQLTFKGHSVVAGHS